MPGRQSLRLVAARHHPLSACQRLRHAVSVVLQRGLAVWQKGRCQPAKPLGAGSTAISIVRPFIASASQVIVSALVRGHGRDAVSFGQQRSRVAHPAHSAARHGLGKPHHCLVVIMRLRCQSVGTVLLHPAKAFGFGSLAHRAGGAVASSVVMRPGKSLRLVARAHHHCHQFDGLL